MCVKEMPETGPERGSRTGEEKGGLMMANFAKHLLCVWNHASWAPGDIKIHLVLRHSKLRKGERQKGD